jgi:hypothetical protein
MLKREGFKRKGFKKEGFKRGGSMEAYRGKYPGCLRVGHGGELRHPEHSAFVAGPWKYGGAFSVS